MDTRLAYYLEIVPLWQLACITVFVLVGALLIPSKYRLGTAIALMAFWLSLHKYNDLGLLAARAKTTYLLPYFLIILAAALHPGPRQRVSAIAWVYVGLALLHPIYLLTVIDRNIALIHSFGLLMLTLAAISVVRTMVDHRATKYVIVSMVWGLGFAIGVGLTSIIFDTDAAFRSGHGRFSPYGALSGLMGPLYFQTAVLAAYLALQEPRRFFKLILSALAVLSIGLAVTTGTRSAVFLTGLAFVPILISMTRRPIFAIFFWILGWVLFTWMTSFTEKLAWGHLLSLETQRTRIFVRYLEVIAERPFFGLLGSQGRTSTVAAEVGAHPHNSYLLALYVGGMSYAVPLFATMFYAGYCAVAVWLSRKKMREDPILISVFATLLACIYLHGFATPMNFAAAESLAFLHFLLAILFMTWWGNKRIFFSRNSAENASIYQQF